MRHFCRTLHNPVTQMVGDVGRHEEPLNWQRSHVLDVAELRLRGSSPHRANPLKYNAAVKRSVPKSEHSGRSRDSIFISAAQSSQLSGLGQPPRPNTRKNRSLDESGKPVPGRAG